MAHEKKNLVILGSSRSDGETKALYEKVFNGLSNKLYDLKELNISFFDYQYQNADDDFQKVAQDMTEHDNIILATPVYWYTMSAQLKVFIDRFSDLITTRKDIGRALKSKKLFVMTTYGATVPIGFEEPFRQTCIYLDIEYVGCLYYYTGKHANMAAHNNKRIERFVRMLKG